MRVLLNLKAGAPSVLRVEERPAPAPAAPLLWPRLRSPAPHAGRRRHGGSHARAARSPLDRSLRERGATGALGTGRFNRGSAQPGLLQDPCARLVARCAVASGPSPRRAASSPIPRRRFASWVAHWLGASACIALSRLRPPWSPAAPLAPRESNDPAALPTACSGRASCYVPDHAQRTDESAQPGASRSRVFPLFALFCCGVARGACLACGDRHCGARRAERL